MINKQRKKIVNSFYHVRRKYKSKIYACTDFVVYMNKEKYQIIQRNLRNG